MGDEFMSEVDYWRKRLNPARPPPGMDKAEFVNDVKYMMMVAGYFKGSFSDDLHVGFRFVDYKRFLRGLNVYGVMSPFEHISGIEPLDSNIVMKWTSCPRNRVQAACDMFMRVNAARAIAVKLSKFKESIS